MSFVKQKKKNVYRIYDNTHVKLIRNYTHFKIANTNETKKIK